MLAVLLNIIGLVFIIVSLGYVNKMLKEEKDIYEEMKLIQNNVKDYSLSIENTLDNFDDLIETSLNKVDTLKIQSLYDIESKKSSEEIQEPQQFKKAVLEDINEMDNPAIEFYEEVINLKNIGLSNKEIARKLNKGIREVEIIIKMWENI